MFKKEKITNILEVGKYYYLASPLYMGDVLFCGGEYVEAPYDFYSEIDVSICYKRENLLPFYVEKLYFDEEQRSDLIEDELGVLEIQTTKKYVEEFQYCIDGIWHFGSDLERYDFEGNVFHDGEYIEITDENEIEKVKEQILKYNSDEEYREALHERLDKIDSELEQQRDKTVKEQAKNS